MSANRTTNGITPHRFALTFFDNYAAAAKHEELYDLASLAIRVNTITKARKSDLPWLKMARFGDTRSQENSLRHNANVVVITGIEADYDGGLVSVDEAVDRLQKHCIEAMVYTSPSHTDAAPRWRVVCPTSCELPPADRAQLVCRLNGALGGILAGESWTLSQSYYFGAVQGNPDHRVELVDGWHIDEVDSLDIIAIGKPATSAKPNGHGGMQTGRANEQELLAQITSGASYHTSFVRLAGLWAFRGVALLDARQRLLAAMDAVPEAQHNARWTARRAQIDRDLLDIYGKEAAKKAAAEPSEPVPAEPPSVAVIAAPEVALARPVEPDEDEDEDETPNEAVLAVVPPELAGFELNEDGIALAFAELHKDELRFDHTRNAWFKWTGSYWKIEDTKLAYSWARNLCRRLKHDAGPDARGVLPLAKAATAAAIERFAQSDRAFAVTTEIWDRDLWMLNTPGGTVDLRTGELRPARPQDFITKQTAVAPATAPDCPIWMEFLEQTTNGDQALIRFLRQWCGYSLTGDTREQALVFGFGQGGNGKGVFLNTVARIMGDYAVTAGMETFTASTHERHTTEIARLRGARMVTASETDKGRAWAENRINQMTGGDPITARFMRQDDFTFMPHFKLFIIGNNKPALKNVNDAARRRFNIIPFVHKPEKPDLNLTEKLRAEWPAILRWAIEGCIDWQMNGLARPQVVLEATSEYFEAQDFYTRWLEECCILISTMSTKPSVLLHSFTQWCATNGEESADNSTLRGMIERTPGLRYAKNNGTHWVRGIGLKPDNLREVG